MRGHRADASSSLEPSLQPFDGLSRSGPLAPPLERELTRSTAASHLLWRRYTAKVDIEGIQSADELLRGLRAAYAHYTPDKAPPPGALLTSVILLGGAHCGAHGGDHVPLDEQTAPHLLPPLSQLLPCSHFVMHGFPTALIAQQQHHLRTYGSTGHEPAPLRLKQADHRATSSIDHRASSSVPRPADFMSLPVAQPPSSSYGRGGDGAPPSRQQLPDATWHQGRTSDSGRGPPVCVAERREQFTAGKVRCSILLPGGAHASVHFETVRSPSAPLPRPSRPRRA